MLQLRKYLSYNLLKRDGEMIIRYVKPQSELGERESQAEHSDIIIQRLNHLYVLTFSKKSIG